MPVTAIDKQTALVLIDLQKGIVGRPLMPNTASDVLSNSASLVNAFRNAGLPIVIVNVIPAERPHNLRAEFKMPSAQFQLEWAEIVPEIDVRYDDIKITKHSPSAFYNTDLDSILKKLNVTGIVLAGIATSIGVEATARAASERGYNITFAKDAMTDLNDKPHENSLTFIFPRLGEIDNTEVIVEKLGERE